MKINVGFFMTCCLIGSSSSVLAAVGCKVNQPIVYESKVLSNLTGRGENKVFPYGNGTPRQMINCFDATGGNINDKSVAIFDMNVGLLNSAIQHEGRTYFAVPDAMVSDRENYKLYFAFNLISNGQPSTNTVIINQNHQQIFPVNGQNDRLTTYGMHLRDVSILVVPLNNAPKSNQIKVNQIGLGKLNFTHGGTRYDNAGTLSLSFDLNFLSETCTFQTKQVQLPKVARDDFYFSSEAGETSFNIDVQCPLSMDGVMSYALLKDANLESANFDGRLKNTGTAKNVGIKLYSNEKPLPISSQLYTPSSILDENDLMTQFPYAFAFGEIFKRQTSHKFKVVYEKLSPAAVEPGTVTAEARLDVFYP